MPLANPIRLEILKRLTAELETISTTDGYVIKTGYVGDLSGHVHRGRTVFGEETDLPMLSLLEVPIPLDQLPPPSSEHGGNYTGDWELVVQGFVTDDVQNPTDPAHLLIADVKKKLGLISKVNRSLKKDGSEGILGLGNTITALKIGSGVVRPPDEYVSSVAYFWLTITLALVEDIKEPYEA